MTDFGVQKQTSIIQKKKTKQEKKGPKEQSLSQQMLDKIYKSEEGVKKTKEARIVPDYKLKFKTQNMNDPEVLRNFLKMVGIPFRPYREIEESLGLTLLKKFIDKFNHDIREQKKTFQHTI